MEPIPISRDAARAARLRHQGLIEPFASPEECVHQLIAVQTQYSQSLPVATAARAKPQKPAYFDKALDIGGPLAKTWTVRWTLHTVHKSDIPLLASAVGRHFHKRYVKGHQEHFKISEKELAKRDERVYQVLREGPLSRKELHQRIPEFQGMPGAGWGWDVAGLAYEGRLYVSSHHGATTFVALEAPSLLSEHEAQVELLRRYLKAYGPITKHDFKVWSGLYMKPCLAAFEALEKELYWYQVEGLERPYASLSPISEELPKPRTKLLAKFDVMIMGVTDRTIFLAPEMYTKVVRPAGQIEATVLVDGQIQGTWRAERMGKNLRIKVDPFVKFGLRTIKALEKEAEGVRVAFGAEKVELRLSS